MTTFRQFPLTGPVALDVCFVSGRSQPPGVHRLAKHLLDVLGALRTRGHTCGRHHALYRDDRQVKLLHVHLSSRHPAADASASPCTHVTARPLRDVVDDLRRFSSVHDDARCDDDSPDCPVHSPPIPEPETHPAFDPCHAESPEQAERRRELNDWLASYNRGCLQQALLARSDARLTLMFTQWPHWISGARPPGRPLADDPRLLAIHEQLDRSRERSRMMLLSEPFTFTLPVLPQTRGDGVNFGRAIGQAVDELTARYPILTSMQTPVKVILLVVPPSQGKDLDNVALAVMPAVRQAVAPGEISSYEVIELARTPGDPPEGLLRLAFGDGLNPQSTWERATDYIEEHMDSDDHW